MNITIKVGTKDTRVSSYNLLFENGLRLKTEDLIWATAGERAAIQAQFLEVVGLILSSGHTVDGLDQIKVGI